MDALPDFSLSAASSADFRFVRLTREYMLGLEGSSIFKGVDSFEEDISEKSKIST